MSVHEIEAEVRRLPAHERVGLADVLKASVDEEAEAARPWPDETERQEEGVRSGKSDVVPGARLPVWLTWRRNTNWTALAALAQIIGALGVVMSVLYLAAQVKQGTMTARRAAAYDITMAANPLLVAIGSDEETASIWARGLVNFDELSPVERIRFSNLAFILAYTWDEALHAYDAGQIDSWALQKATGSITALARLPGFKAWYSLRRDFLSRELQERLDAEGRLEPPEATNLLYRGF